LALEGPNVSGLSSELGSLIGGELFGLPILGVGGWFFGRSTVPRQKASTVPLSEGRSVSARSVNEAAVTAQSVDSFSMYWLRKYSFFYSHAEQMLSSCEVTSAKSVGIQRLKALAVVPIRW